MEDDKIVELYWQRDERAITETGQKYGPRCHRLAQSILSDRSDAEECVGDTYFALWNRLPPERPRHFPAYVLAITRNLSFQRLRGRTAQKRGGGELALALDELAELLPAADCVEQRVELQELAGAVGQFLTSLSSADRVIFIGRYWLLKPVAEIAGQLDCSQSRVKTSLYRTRQKLQKHLHREGLL